MSKSFATFSGDNWMYPYQCTWEILYKPYIVGIYGFIIPKNQVLNGTESQRTPISVSCDRAIRYSGFFLGWWKVGPVGDFLKTYPWNIHQFPNQEFMFRNSNIIWDFGDAPRVWVTRVIFHARTWRIIPVSKWLVTPVYKPFRPFGRGTTLRPT